MSSKTTVYPDRQIPNTAAGRIDADGYRVINLDGADYFAHDIAWMLAHGRPPVSPLIHLDGNRDNNAIANLVESQPQ